MTTDDRRQQAERHAENYAPAPTGGSAMAAFCGAFMALGTDAAVSGFYGWRVQDHVPLAVAVTVTGALVAFIGYKRLARKNRRAVRAELDKLEA